MEKHSRGIDQDRILSELAGDQEIPTALKFVRRCKLNSDGHKCLVMDLEGDKLKNFEIIKFS